MPVSGLKEHLIFPERRKVLHGRDFPYWWVFARGRSLGYQRGLKVASWFARVRLREGRYCQTRLGEADDDLTADGAQVLSFDQAYDKAEAWCTAHAAKAISRHMDHQSEPRYPRLPPSPPYTVAHAMVGYMRWYRENRQGFSRIYYDCRAFILPRFGNIPVDQLTTRMIREWLDELVESSPRIRVRRGEKPHYRQKTDDPDALRQRRNSVNRTLSILKAGLNRAYEYGYVDSNLAWSRVKRFRRADPPVPLYLEKDQCQALITVCSPDLQVLVIGALVSGCRIGELRRIRVGDYLADLKRLIIRAPKGGRPRHVSLSDEGANFFEEQSKDRQSDELMFTREDGRPWRVQTHHRPFHKATYAAGLDPKVNFHTLRHTYATHAAMAGIPLAVVAKQLGHRDTRMVERHYAHFGSSYIDDVIQEKLPRFIS